MNMIKTSRAHLFEPVGRKMSHGGHTFYAEEVRHRENQGKIERWQIWRSPTCQIYIMFELNENAEKGVWRSTTYHFSTGKQGALEHAVAVHESRMKQALNLIRQYHADWLNESAVNKTTLL